MIFTCKLVGLPAYRYLCWLRMLTGWHELVIDMFSHWMCGHTMRFYIWFSIDLLRKVDWSQLLRWVVTWYNFTIDFWWIKLIQYICCTGKVIVTSRFSPENPLKIGRTSNFFRLCFWLRWSHGSILVESELEQKIWWKIASCDRIFRLKLEFVCSILVSKLLISM